MEIFLGILLFVFFVWVLIKGWILLVNSIMNPLIKKAEKRDAEALKNNPEYQFWTKAEEFVNELDRVIKNSTIIHRKSGDNHVGDKKTDNIYIAKHHRLFEGHKQAEELWASFKKGYEQLEKQYEDYLEWCYENNEKPVIDPPVTDR